jgi:outer membrane protein TolC
LKEAKKELDTAQQKLDTAQQKLDTAQQKLDTAQQKLDIAQQNYLAVKYKSPNSDETEFAKKRVESAQKGVESAQKGVESAQKGVEDAQKIVSALTSHYEQLLSKNYFYFFKSLTSISLRCSYWWCHNRKRYIIF